MWIKHIEWLHQELVTPIQHKRKEVSLLGNLCLLVNLFLSKLGQLFPRDFMGLCETVGSFVDVLSQSVRVVLLTRY